MPVIFFEVVWGDARAEYLTVMKNPMLLKHPKCHILQIPEVFGDYQSRSEQANIACFQLFTICLTLKTYTGG